MKELVDRQLRTKTGSPYRAAQISILRWALNEQGGHRTSSMVLPELQLGNTQERIIYALYPDKELSIGELQEITLASKQMGSSLRSMIVRGMIIVDGAGNLTKDRLVKLTSDGQLIGQHLVKLRKSSEEASHFEVLSPTT